MVTPVSFDDLARETRPRLSAALMAKPCVRCGAVARNPSGACRPCATRRRGSALRREAAEGPCRRCGAVDRFPSGACRACEAAWRAKRPSGKRPSAAWMAKPCRKCGTVDRNPSGSCRPCHAAARRARGQALALLGAPCARCGVADRFPSGECRACSKARAKAGLSPTRMLTLCPRCGVADRNAWGVCRQCRTAADRRYKSRNRHNKTAFGLATAGAVIAQLLETLESNHGP